MLSREQLQQVEPRIKVIQIVCLALMAGAVAAALVMFVLREEPKMTTVLGVLQWLGVGFVVIELVPAFVISAVVRKGAVNEVAKANDRLESSDNMPIRLIDGFVSSVIVHFAIVQGAILMNLVFWLIEGSVFNLVAAGFCLLLMLFLFPTNSKSLGTVEGMLRDAQAARQSS